MRVLLILLGSLSLSIASPSPAGFCCQAQSSEQPPNCNNTINSTQCTALSPANKWVTTCPESGICGRPPLEEGIIVGIAIASFAGVCLAGGIFLCMLRRRKRRNQILKNRLLSGPEYFDETIGEAYKQPAN
jgi:hypothetical protein